MIQKTAAALLCMLLTLSLAACSSSPADETTAPTTTNGAPAATTTVPETSAPEETGFEEMVLVDNDDIFFKITGIEEDPIWGYSLKVYIENKTDIELMFSVDDVSVNGFMCDPFWAESVAAGKKSNSSISWFESAFSENGITEVEEITFTLQAYDSNDFTAEDVLLETFTVKP